MTQKVLCDREVALFSWCGMWGVPIAFVLAGDNLIISRGKKPSNKCSVEWGPTVILRGKNPQDRMSALGQKRTLECVRAMSALPPKADIGTQSRDVRFVQKGDMGTHSMIESARAMRVGGIKMPSFLAVFWLIISSNVVGCCTGRSEGLAPFKILSI